MRKPLTAGGARPHTRRARPEPPPPGTAEARDKAREAALRLLAAKDRSASDLRARLRRKGFDPRDIEDALSALQRTGLQDDERFARDFAEEAVARRGLSSTAIRNELRRHGIPPALADQAAATAPRDDEETARALARQKAARMRDADPRDRIRRLVGLLARRGYEPEVCYRIAREVGAD